MALLLANSMRMLAGHYGGQLAVVDILLALPASELFARSSYQRERGERERESERARPPAELAMGELVSDRFCHVNPPIAH